MPGLSLFSGQQHIQAFGAVCAAGEVVICWGPDAAGFEAHREAVPPQRQKNSYLDTLTAHTLSSSEKASLATSGLCLLLCNSSQGFLSYQLWALKLQVMTLNQIIPEALKRPVLESWSYLLAGWRELNPLTSLSFRGTIPQSRDKTTFRGPLKGRRDRGDVR